MAKIKQRNILKSHQWDIYESINARCPYCRKWTNKSYDTWEEKDVIKCFWCKKGFILGKQK